MSIEDSDRAADAAPTAEPSMLKLDFSSNAVLRQVATMLRRVWLLDPPLSAEELANPATVQECLRSMCEAIGNGITDDPAEAKWDHGAWLAHTQLKVLEDPAVVATAGGGDNDAAPPASSDLRSVVSPWREEIYDIYRHLFVDLWRVLQATPEIGRLGRYDPSKGDAVSLVVLQAEESKVDKTAFRTDTFLYPVWVNPKATISFSADESVHSWSEGEESTWTTGLWVQEGKDVTITTKMDGVSDDKTGAAAVFVTGHCDEREKQTSGGTTAGQPEENGPAETGASA